MTDQATEELLTLSELDPDDILLVKESGVDRIKQVVARNTYFGAYEVVAAVFRFTDNGGSDNTIEFLNDVSGGHKGHNVTSISLDADTVNLTFAKTFSQIGVIVANGDDLLSPYHFGVEATTTGAEITIKDSSGNSVNPLTNTGIKGTNNAVWVLGIMWP